MIPSDNEITRVVVVQGATNLLNALAVLEFDRSQNPTQKYRDYLIIGGLYGGREGDESIRQVCVRLAALWPFAAICDSIRIETLVFHSAIDFERAAGLLARELGAPSVSAVFLVRNFQLINELVLAAFPRAYATIYGDMFGTHDSDSTQYTYYRAAGALPVHRLTAVTPLERIEGLFERYPIVQIPVPFLSDVLARASHLLASELKALTSGFLKPGESTTIVLTSFETEGEGIDGTLEKEVQAYVETVRRHIGPGQPLLLKPHPRARNFQTALLDRELTEAGYRCRALENAKAIPVELLMGPLHVQTLVANFSCCTVAIGAIFPADIVVGLGATLLQQIVSPYYKALQMGDEAMRVLATRDAQRGVMRLIRFKEWRDLVPEPDSVRCTFSGARFQSHCVEAAPVFPVPRMRRLLSRPRWMARMFAKRLSAFAQRRLGFR